MPRQTSNVSSSRNGQRGNSRDPRQGGNNQQGYGRNQNQREPIKNKPDPLKLRDITYLDYRDIRILERFLNDRGKLLPNRITGVSAKGQRTLETAVKHARHLALLPFVAEGMK
ncbi:MAG TPA: 30S ribosomal protein S18 [Candidatus Kapabacteria bacterium]|jgi:small subunit ribosomal protein S18